MQKLSTALILLLAAACSTGTQGNTDGGSGHTLTLQVTGLGAGSITSTPAGVTDCARDGGTCIATFEENSQVTLTPTTNAGDVFLGWSGGACEGFGNCVVTLDADATLSATFVPIVFASYLQLPDVVANPNSSANLWMVHGDGSGLAPLTRSQNAYHWFPSWSPNGEKITWGSTLSPTPPYADTTGSYNIWVSNADGSSAAPLTSFTTASAFTARWVPDGRVLYSANAPANHSDTSSSANNFFIVNPDGTNRVSLSDLTTPASDGASMQSDGEFMYFSSRRGLDEASKETAIARNIWRVKLDGTEPQALTTSTVVTSRHPSLSPDNQTVAYISNRVIAGTDATQTAYNIWLMNKDGSNQRVLTQGTVATMFTKPVWSVDGQYLYFSSDRKLDGSDATESGYNIWRVKVSDGALNHVAGLATASSYYPVPLPDGRVVFESNRNLNLTDSAGPQTNLWIAKGDGTGLDALTESTVGSSYSPNNDD